MFQVLLLFTICIFFSISPNVTANNEDFQAQIRANSGYFLNTYADWLNQGDSQNANWTKNFLKELDKKPSTEIGEWRTALMRLVDLSKHAHFFGQETGFIEDPKVIPILIAALQADDPQTNDFALVTLTSATRQSDLLSQSDQIKKALGSDWNPNTLRLLARLPLSPEKRDEILARPDLESQVKARLGDREAERTLISNFGAEKDYARKKRLAEQLGYIGTEESAKALVKGLRSDVKMQGFYEERSIRCQILLALGKIYQDERLFTRDAVLLTSSSDERFEQIRGLQNYISEINAWAKQKFGKPAWDTEDVWFIRLRHMPFVTPE